MNYNNFMKSIFIPLLLALLSNQVFAWDIYRCEKNLTLTTAYGGKVAKSFNGLTYLAYKKDNPLLEFITSDKSFPNLVKNKVSPDWKYKNVHKANGLITAFLRQKGYPEDFQVVTLDTKNNIFFKTSNRKTDSFYKGKYTVWGECKVEVQTQD